MTRSAGSCASLGVWIALGLCIAGPTASVFAAAQEPMKAGTSASTLRDRRLKPPLLLDIPAAAAEAELIVIGGTSFVPIRMMSRAARAKPGPVVAYSLEVHQCLKGAYQHPSRDGKPFIHIPAGRRGMATGKVPTLPVHAEGKSYIYFLRLQRAGATGRPRESPLSPDRWFIPATPENIEAVREAIPLPAEWGSPSDGLQLGLRTTKPSYRVGEPIDIEVCIKNVSDRSVTLPQHRLATRDWYPFTGFFGRTEIRRVSGGGYSHGAGRNGSLSKPIVAGQPSTLPPVSLGPGEVYIERIRLNSWQWSTSDGLPPFVPGTRWMLQAQFSTTKLPVRFVGNPDLWRGGLRSEYVELRID